MEANDMKAVNTKTFRKIAKMIRRLVDHIRKEKSLSEKLAREAFDQIDDLAKEALIANPRNCDVGTPEEQAKRKQAYCKDRGCRGCPISAGNTLLCDLGWAQMPYKEGDSDGNPHKKRS